LKPVGEYYFDFAVRLHKIANRRLLLPIKFHRWSAIAPGLKAANWTTGVSLDELIPDKKRRAEVRRGLQRSAEVPIAKIDHDGFFLSQFGRLNELPLVSEAAFLPRKKHDLWLVATGKGIGVRKTFTGNADGFLRELEILHVLGNAGCNVPKLIRVEPETLSFTTSFIRGRVLREELAVKGALVRDRDMTSASKLCRESRIREGRRFLSQVVGAKFVERLWGELVKLHEAGVVWSDIKYGNVIIEEPSGLPYLIDFEGSLYFPRKGPLFRGLRGRDIRKFNQHFR